MDVVKPLLDHLQAHMAAYVMGGIVVLIVMFFTRRFSVPIILKLLELTAYFVVMHVALSVFVRLVDWFKGETAMRALRETAEDAAPGWKTPLVEFWDKEQYFPSWIPYMEIGFCVAITVLVWHFRPIFIKPKEKPKAAPPPKPGSKSRTSHMAGSYLSMEGIEPRTKKGRRGRKGTRR